MKAHEILNRVHSDRFVALMRFQAQRAHALYDEAIALLPAADRRSQKPGLMMASIYRTLMRCLSTWKSSRAISSSSVR